MNFSIQAIYTWYRNTLRNPKYRWWLILGTLLYLFSPIDIVPDFLPFVGEIDDLAVLTLLITEVSQLLADRIRSKQDLSETFPDAQSQPVDVDSVSVE